MNEWTKFNNCTIFWWVAGFALGLGTYAALSGFFGVILGLAVFILVGLGGSRFFCVGSASGVNTGVTYTAPAVGSDTPAIAAAAARAAIQNITQYAPPSAVVTGAAPNRAATTPEPVKAKPEKAKPEKAKAEKPEPEKPKTEKPKPAAAAPSPAPEAAEGKRPEALSAPREGKADDLKLIKGVGPKLEKLCHSMGFYHYDQIANWTAEEVAWVDENLEGFKGRVSRDNWIEQARILAGGGETAFSKRVEDGDVY